MLCFFPLLLCPPFRFGCSYVLSLIFAISINYNLCGICAIRLRTATFVYFLFFFFLIRCNLLLTHEHGHANGSGSSRWVIDVYFVTNKCVSRTEKSTNASTREIERACPNLISVCRECQHVGGIVVFCSFVFNSTGDGFQSSDLYSLHFKYNSSWMKCQSIFAI